MSLVTKVLVKTPATHCDCCGRTHMLKAFTIVDDEFDAIDLGVICSGKWFGVALTGNIHKSAQRLERKIATLPRDEFLEIVENIQFAIEENNS